VSAQTFDREWGHHLSETERYIQAKGPTRGLGQPSLVVSCGQRGKMRPPGGAGSLEKKFAISQTNTRVDRKAIGGGAGNGNAGKTAKGGRIAKRRDEL